MKWLTAFVAKNCKAERRLASWEARKTTRLPIGGKVIAKKKCTGIYFRKILKGQRNLAEKAMVTHSSTLGWKIPWMEEPGGLQSMRS